jgi:hypothetical protein
MGCVLEYDEIMITGFTDAISFEPVFRATAR